MKITIKIDTANDAFSGDASIETIRILRGLILKLERNEIDIHPGEAATLRDYNGNTIGSFKVTH